MPVPIGELAPPPADANAPAASERAEAILAAAEGQLLRALAETEGLALSRAELGDAVRGQLAAKIGLHLDPGVRDTLLGFARVLVPAIDRELSASAEVIDRALTRLVRDGRVGFAIHRLEARFWSLRPAVASAPAEPSSPPVAEAASRRAARPRNASVRRRPSQEATAPAA